MSQASSSRWWVAAAGVALVLPAVWAIHSQVFGQSAKAGSFEGVELGMTMDQVRSRFAGRWESKSRPDGLVVARWEPPDQESDVKAATFELHNGLLVAIRAQVRSDTAEDPLVIHSDVVRRTELGADGTASVVLIARNCPLHAAEVEQLIASR